MRGYSSITILGNLGGDPEGRFTSSQIEVSKFSVAVNVKYRDVETAEWFDCVAFDKLAGICNQFLKKGTPVFIQGAQKTNKWEHEGKTFVRKEVIVHQVRFLGGKDETGTNASRPTVPEGAPDVEDDDIPF